MVPGSNPSLINRELIFRSRPLTQTQAVSVNAWNSPGVVKRIRLRLDQPHITRVIDSRGKPFIDGVAHHVDCAFERMHLRAVDVQPQSKRTFQIRQERVGGLYPKAARLVRDFSDHAPAFTE